MAKKTESKKHEKAESPKKEKSEKAMPPWPMPSKKSGKKGC